MRPGLHGRLPSPYLTLIFSLEGPVTGGLTPEQARGPDAFRMDIVVGGLQQAPAYVRQPERESGVQLAVHPLAARALFGLPTAELTGCAVAGGTDLLGRSGAEVHERLREQDRWEERFATLTSFLRTQLARAQHTPGVRDEVAEARTWLARHHGAGTIRGLAAHVALSERRLTTLFRAETGLTPKQAARLMRFEREEAGSSGRVRARPARSGPGGRRLRLLRPLPPGARLTASTPV